MMFDMLYSVLQQRWLNKICSFPHNNEFMLRIKYLSGMPPRGGQQLLVSMHHFQIIMGRNCSEW